MGVYYMHEMEIGAFARIVRIPKELPLKRRFYDLGLTEGCKIGSMFRAPLGGMSAYKIRGALIAIRDIDCNKIIVEDSE